MFDNPSRRVLNNHVLRLHTKLIIHPQWLAEFNIPGGWEGLLTQAMDNAARSASSPILAYKFEPNGVLDRLPMEGAVFVPCL